MGRQVAGFDRLGSREDGRPLHRVLQLAHVAGPGVVEEPLHRARAQPEDATLTPREALRGSVRPAAECPHAARAAAAARSDHGEAVEQIFAKAVPGGSCGSRSRLVAATTRASTVMAWRRPTGANFSALERRAGALPEARAPSRRSRRGTRCRRGPPRTAPACSRRAPVNAPLTCPKISDSSSVSGSAPQLMATKGRALAGRRDARPWR